MMRILCYGDSNTWGYIPSLATRYTDVVRWTGKMQKILGDEFDIIEEGLNGRTTNLEDPGTPGRNGAVYLPPCLSTHQPLDAVIIALGTNDLKEQFHRDAEDIVSGILELVNLTKQALYAHNPCELKILLVSPAYLGAGIGQSAFGEEFTDRSYQVSQEIAEPLQKLAEAEGCYFLDLAELGELTGSDYVHFTVDAHDLIASAVSEIVREMFA